MHVVRVCVLSCVRACVRGWQIPFAIFMVLGLDFTGFHVRFRDISRGGVRLIKSTPENYAANRKTQFLENFNLAYVHACGTRACVYACCVCMWFLSCLRLLLLLCVGVP